MPIPATSGYQPFSILDAWVYPFSAGIPGTGVDMPGIIEVTSDPQTTVVEHRGDGTVTAKVATLDSLDLTVTVGSWDFGAISKLVGGTVGATTGTTPNQVQSITHATTDAPADCAISVQTSSKSADGGAARLSFPRCQHTGLVSYGLTDQEFQDLEIPMSAIAETSAQKIAIVSHYETYTALTATYTP